MDAFRAKKSLGQHFLNNQKDLMIIVEAARLTKKDTVLEIGPGLGSLTALLAKRAGLVIAIEKDKTLYERLHASFTHNQNVRIVLGDALRTDFASLGLKNSTFKVVANIPYYLTSAIIRKLMSKNPKPSEAVLMIQKEVAQRIVSQPPHLSILALSVLFFGTPRIIGSVPKEHFSPKPKVDSAIIKITLHAHNPHQSLEPIFFKLVRAGFAQKRKTLLNSLSSSLGIPKKDAQSLLLRSSIRENARAQEISFDGWIKLAVMSKKLRYN